MAPKGFGVVTAYYNPVGYRTRRENYDRFKAGLGDIPLLTVECAIGNAPFDLPPASDVIQLRTLDVLWHKERLLNLGIQALPGDISVVGWFDGDVLFPEPHWAVDAVRLAEEGALVQPFSTVVRLPRGHSVDDGEGERWPSFASVYRSRPNVALTGKFDVHGHSGFAWVAKRDLIQEVGLYDAAAIGSGDHLMAHAFVGDWHGPCVRRYFLDNHAHWRHYEAWAKCMYAGVRSRVRAVEGPIWHLWHGEAAGRRYVGRNHELSGMAFDPTKDLYAEPNGCWRWADHRNDLREWAVAYFENRKEDGDGFHN